MMTPVAGTMTWLAAEEKIDGCGEGDGHAGGVGRDDVRGAVAGNRG